MVTENTGDNMGFERNCLREMFPCVHRVLTVELFITANNLEKKSESCSPREEISLWYIHTIEKCELPK